MKHESWKTVQNQHGLITLSTTIPYYLFSKSCLALFIYTLTRSFTARSKIIKIKNIYSVVQLLNKSFGGTANLVLHCDYSFVWTRQQKKIPGSHFAFSTPNPHGYYFYILKHHQWPSIPVSVCPQRRSKLQLQDFTLVSQK